MQKYQDDICPLKQKSLGVSFNYTAIPSELSVALTQWANQVHCHIYVQIKVTYIRLTWWTPMSCTVIIYMTCQNLHNKNPGQAGAQKKEEIQRGICLLNGRVSLYFWPCHFGFKMIKFNDLCFIEGCSWCIGFVLYEFECWHCSIERQFLLDWWLLIEHGFNKIGQRSLHA